MGGIHDSITELTGNTPIVRLNNIERENSFSAAVFAKLELLNPTRSTSDRAVKSFMEKALSEGALRPGSEIIAAADAGTGAALGQWAAANGLALTLVLPAGTRREIRKLIGGFGAKVIAAQKPSAASAAAQAREIYEGKEAALFFDGFSTEENAEAHYRCTGPEIWEDLGDKAELFIASAEALGAISGAGKFLKEKNPAIQLVSVVLEGSEPGDAENADSVITVSRKEAGRWSAELARREGILAGLSSGAALAAAADFAGDSKNAGRSIVVLLADTGERWLSTGIFGEILTPPEPF